MNEDLIRQLILGFIILKISDKIHDTLASCWQLTDRMDLTSASGFLVLFRSSSLSYITNLGSPVLIHSLHSA